LLWAWATTISPMQSTSAIARMVSLLSELSATTTQDDPALRIVQSEGPISGRSSGVDGGLIE
jgi:hypothetical protein